MSHVVHLKVVDVPLPLVSAPLFLPNNLLCGEITVRQLRTGEQGDVVLQLLKQRLLLLSNRRINSSLEPLVEIAVAEYRSGEIPFRLARRDSEVFHHMADIRRLEHALQMRNCHRRDCVEALLIQAARPRNVAKGYAGNP